jgi:hypothetical protein
MAMQITIAKEIIKYAASTSAAKAIAKYGKKAYEEAKKHVKDMKSKKTTGQKQSEKGTKGQRTYREGQRKAGVAGGAAGYTAGNVDLSGSSNSLPVADMSRSIDVRGTGEGIRYFQDGKEVRMPKKGYN